MLLFTQTHNAAARSKVARLPRRFPGPFCVSPPPSLSLLHTHTLPLLTVHLSASLRTSLCPQGTPQISTTTGKTPQAPAAFSLLSLNPRRFSYGWNNSPPGVISLNANTRSPILFLTDFLPLTALPPLPLLAPPPLLLPLLPPPPPCLPSVMINVTPALRTALPSTHLSVNSVSRTGVCDNQDPAKLYGLQTEVLNSY